MTRLRGMLTLPTLLIAGLLLSPTLVGPVAFAEDVLMTYVVNDDLNLGEVAVILYGDHRRWKSIAEWNGLTPPYRLKTGDVLQLHEAPILTEAQGEARLLAQWRAYFGLSKPSEGGIRPDAQGASEIQVRGEFEHRLQVQRAAEGGSAVVSGSELQDQAETLVQEGDLNAALESFRTSRMKDPDLVSAWFQEIEILQKLNRQAEARETAEELVKRKPFLRKVVGIKAILHPDGEVSP